MKLLEAKKSEKKIQLERLLEKGTVMVFVDSRRAGVVVPPQHRDNPRLALNLDYAFKIPDFRVLGDRVEASLSFDKKDFFCVLPFDAIYLYTSQFAGEAVIFPEDVPAEFAAGLLQEVSVAKEVAPQQTATGEKKKKGSHLRLVK